MMKGLNLKLNLKKFSIPTITFFVGILLAIVVNGAMATFEDDGLIHACVPTGNGSLRIVNAEDDCNTNETEMVWSGDEFAGFGSFKSNQLIGYTFNNGITANWSFRRFDNGNLTNSDIEGAFMKSASFKNTNFTGAKLYANDLTDADFSNANLHEAEISASTVTNTDFSSADLTNSQFHANGGGDISTIDNADFTDADFTDADLEGTDLSNSTLSGATWDNTICPDGTNSDSHSNTCIGHLAP